MFGARIGVGVGGITTLVCGLPELTEELRNDVMDLIRLQMSMGPEFAQMSLSERESQEVYAFGQFVMKRNEEAMLLALEQCFGPNPVNWEGVMVMVRCGRRTVSRVFTSAEFGPQ